ncbi:MAG: ferric reductase-like transmembrane domain-containing protein [Dermatophilaceae bacterium]
MSVTVEGQPAVPHSETRDATPDVARLRSPGPVPRWWRDAVASGTWASVLAVVAMWVAGGGVQALAAPASGLTSAGRLAGLLAADLLLIQVLLMARIPLVERVYGQDELARRHRLVGFTSVTLMLGHVVLIGLGYAAQDQQDVLAQVWDMLVNYPGVLLAVAGTALLLMVSATSIKRARAAMRYESWHLLHLYAYLGVGLAVPHQLWTGQEFASNPVATVFWWTLWVAAAGAVLVWRVRMPVYRTLLHGLRVSAVVRESPDVVSVWMSGRRMHRVRAEAGQFFVWRFLDGPGWSRGHPYSLSAPPHGNTLRITVKDLGDGSAAVATLRPGTRVAIEGPYGRLHAGVRIQRKVLLLAAGIGVTPLRALLEELSQRPGDVTLLYRASTHWDLIFQDELTAVATATGARVLTAVGHRVLDRSSWLPDNAAHLSDVDALRHLVPDIAEHDVYICGADGWTDAARQAALGAGVPSGRIHRERFSW